MLMDNNQPVFGAQPTEMPQPVPMQPAAQPMQPAQPMQSAQPMQVAQPMQMPDVNTNPVTGAPMMQTSISSNQAPYRNDASSLVKTILIVALSLVSVTFIGLFIWMFTQYSSAREDVDGQIADAVVVAVDENTTKLESEFAEREKYPFQTFAGPADYGELTFEYPKTWSVYVAKDASNGGDFEAYFNPVEVKEVSNETIDSLRLTIKDRAFDDVADEYQRELEGEAPNLSLNAVTIGKDSKINANRYTGKIPNTEHSGIIVIFKIRDKTVIMQTDSVLFEKDFNALLASVRFNG